MFHFHNEINLSTPYTKIESRKSLNSARYNIICYIKYTIFIIFILYFSDNNSPKIDENILPDSKDEFVEKLKQEKSDEQDHSNVKECEQEAGPSNKIPIPKISSTSHRIHKLKKNKKTLSNFIS